MSKETFVQGTIVQGTIVQGTIVQGMIVQEDFCPRRLLSKEAFRYDKLAQIIFSLSLMKIHMSNLIKNEKNNVNRLLFYRNLLLGQKSPWTKVSLDNRPLDNCPLDKSLLGQTSLGQLSPHPPEAKKLIKTKWLQF